MVRFAPSFASLVLTGLLAGGCTVAVEPVAPQPPPVPPTTVETPTKPPVTAIPLIWQPGHWNWTGSSFAWQPGLWVERDGHGPMWQPGYWALSGGVYTWVPAHWL